MGIKNLFIKSDEDEHKGRAAPPPTRPSSLGVQLGGNVVSGATSRSYLGPGRRHVQAAPMATTVVTPTAVDSEFSAEIENQLMGVPAPKGFDAFLAALENLSQFIPDEGDCFKAAMKMAAGHGLTPKQIIETLRSKLDELQQIQATFQRDIKREAEESSAAREQEQRALTAQIADLQRRISALQEQMQGLSHDERTLEEANAKMEEKIAQVTRRHTGAHSFHVGRTQELLEKVQKHLGQ